MKKELSKTFMLLLILTFATIIIFNLPLVHSLKVILILVLFSLKFLSVTFQFMELKKAHVFWKASIISILVLINLIIIIS
jgi:hypothetical protein